MFILDTNVLSELRKRKTGRADPRVVAWVKNVDAATVHLSVMTIFEIELGILSIQRRDPRQADHLREWMSTKVMPEFQDRLLPIDATVARRCAALHVPDPRPERDALIAATALVHGMTVVTRDTKDFMSMGVRVVDPWVAVSR